MAKGTSFVCQQCGFESPKWLGKCPNCNTWASMVEFTESTGGRGSRRKGEAKNPLTLKDSAKLRGKREPTGIGELDLVLGGGLVPGQVVLLAGEPGIGKSTLLLELSSHMVPAFYVSGEESISQIGVRAERMKITSEKLSFLEETNVDNILATLEREIKSVTYKAIIIDSVQTMYTEELTGTPGSVGQVRETTFRLIRFAKAKNIPVILIGHVTKDGSVAGPSTLAHMVDTVLWFEGDRLNNLRILRSIKNRFASTDEVGIFKMSHRGLVGASENELVFLDSELNKSVVGSVVTCVIEGTRPILVEVQALIVPSKLANPRRVVHGIDPKKLELIIAVLVRYCHLPLLTHDVFVNIVGGIKVKDPGIDLAVAFAIASSTKDKAIKRNTLVVGEVGLLGEIRPAPEEERRIKRGTRQGFTHSISSAQYKLLSSALKENL